MLDICKSAEAENDLIGIWLYSFEQWGPAQADHYLDAIGTALLLLAENPLMGSACDTIRPGYRHFLVREHDLYYRIEGNELYLVRVLAKDMLVERHL